MFIMQLPQPPTTGKLALEQAFDLQIVNAFAANRYDDLLLIIFLFVASAIQFIELIFPILFASKMKSH